MNARNFSEAPAPAEPGRWASHPASPRSARASLAATGGESSPLGWEPAVPLGRRIARSLNVPAIVGVAVFAVVLVVTAAIVLRSLVAAPAGGEPGLGLLESRAGDSSTASPEAARGAEGAVAPLLVHVVGEVVSPGVVELHPGSRVRDAIAAAGGATETAVLSGVNLARTVSDGEQIVVPDAQGAQVLASSGAAGDGSGGVININRATAEQLEQLPRVGPALARRIVEWRTAHGGFASVDQLLEVSGIGAKTLEGFRDRVTV